MASSTQRISVATTGSTRGRREFELRLAPHSESAVIDTLGSYFVRVLRSVTARANADPLRTAWTRVAAPSGKIGYAAPDTLMSLSAAQLCYGKDVTGRWTIAGFVGGAD